MRVKSNKYKISYNNIIIVHFICIIVVINQSRFSKNNAFTFDIDTTISDEKLINKLRKNNFIAENAFAFSRGIEISKNGLVTKCPLCGYEQPILKHQIGSTKICSKCNKEIKVNNS